jgi:hypothetical protein
MVTIRHGITYITSALRDCPNAMHAAHPLGTCIKDWSLWLLWLVKLLDLGCTSMQHDMPAALMLPHCAVSKEGGLSRISNWDVLSEHEKAVRLCYLCA